MQIVLHVLTWNKFQNIKVYLMFGRICFHSFFLEKYLDDMDNKKGLGDITISNFTITNKIK